MNFPVAHGDTSKKEGQERELNARSKNKKKKRTRAIHIRNKIFFNEIEEYN